MRVCSTISVSMLAAVTAATEAEDWSSPSLDPFKLLDGVKFLNKGDGYNGSEWTESDYLTGGDYLSGFGAYEPSKAEPYSEVAQAERYKVDQAYPYEPVEYVDRKEDSYSGR